MTELDSDRRRQKAQTNFLMRIIATAAVWSIAVAISVRLRHPMISLTLVALSVGLSVLIWVQPSPNK